MSKEYCRLCLSTERVINVFGEELNNSEQLRKCVFTCWGVDILASDVISKNVCHICCELSIKIFKFKKSVIANDISLKRLFKQEDHNKEMEVHNTTLDEFLLKKTDIKIQRKDGSRPSISSSKITKRYVVHPSIRKMMKKYPKIVIPNNLIKVDCDPKIHITNLDLSKVNFKYSNKVLSDSSASTSKSDENINARVEENNEKCLISDNSKEKRQTNAMCDEENKGVKEGESKRKRYSEASGSGKKIKVNSETTLSESSKISVDNESQENVTQNKAKGPEISNYFTSQGNKSKYVPNNIVNNDGDTSFENTVRSEATNTLLFEDLPERSSDIPFTDSLNEDTSGRKVLRQRKSRPSFFADEAMYYWDEDCTSFEDQLNCSLLETVSEQLTYTCNICDKMFDEKKNLKIHKKIMHNKCVVCNKTFKSQKLLTSHLKATCYKKVVANQPILCLTKCDDLIPKTTSNCDLIEQPVTTSNDVVLQTTTLSDTGYEILCISDDDDDETKPLENQKQENTHSFDSKDKERINQIFVKYHGDTTPSHKTVECQEDSQLYAASMGKGQATMTNMYPILKHYRVPVTLDSSDSMKVDVAATPKVSKPAVDQTSKSSNWAGFPIRLLKDQVMSGKFGGGRYIAPKPPTEQNRSNLLKDALVAANIVQEKSATATSNTAPIRILNITAGQQSQNHKQQPSTSFTNNKEQSQSNKQLSSTTLSNITKQQFQMNKQQSQMNKQQSQTNKQQSQTNKQQSQTNKQQSQTNKKQSQTNKQQSSTTPPNASKQQSRNNKQKPSTSLPDNVTKSQNNKQQTSTSSEKIYAIQSLPIPTILNGQQQDLQNQNIVPKMRIVRANGSAKPSHQNHFLGLQQIPTQAIIPQTQRSDPQPLTFQQSTFAIHPQTLIQTPQGYILSTNQNTYSQTSHNSNNQNIIISTNNQNPSNPTLSFTISNKALITPSNPNHYAPNVTVQPTRPIAHPSGNPQFSILRPILARPQTQQRPVQGNTNRSVSNTLAQPQPQRPVQTNTDQNVSNANVLNTNVNTQEGKVNHKPLNIRVKAPWELK